MDAWHELYPLTGDLANNYATYGRNEDRQNCVCAVGYLKLWPQTSGRGMLPALHIAAPVHLR